MNILIENNICRISTGMAIIVHKQHAMTTALENCLVLGAEGISINDDPTRTELARLLDNFCGVGSAIQGTGQQHDLNSLSAQPIFNGGRCLSQSKDYLPTI